MPLLDAAKELYNLPYQMGEMLFWFVVAWTSVLYAFGIGYLAKWRKHSFTWGVIFGLFSCWGIGSIANILFEDEILAALIAFNVGPTFYLVRRAGLAPVKVLGVGKGQAALEGFSCPSCSAAGLNSLMKNCPKCGVDVSLKHLDGLA